MFQKLADRVGRAEKKIDILYEGEGVKMCCRFALGHE